MTFAAVALPAGPETYEGRSVVAIRFDPADQPLPPAELAIGVEPLKAGNTLHPGDLHLAMEHLFATGRYRDIAVDIKEEGSGIAVSFVTVAERFVRGVVVTGAAEPPSAGQLANTTKFDLGQAFRQTQMRQATESILDNLRLNGLYGAKVNSRIEPVNIAEQVDLFFDIDPGKRARYDTPVIKGTDLKKTEQNIVGATRWRKFLMKSWRDVTDSRTTQGVDRIRRSYQKKDYLMSRVQLDQMAYDPAANTVTPHITIEAGPKVQVVTQGVKISRGKLEQLIPVYQEHAVDKDLLVEGRRNLLAYLEAKGYFEADVQYDIKKEGPNDQTIVYDITRGERHKLTMLEIDGNKYFDDQTIRERIYITPSSLIRFRHGRYSGEYLRRDINAIKDLYRANGFRDVDVDSRVQDNYPKPNSVAVFLNIEEGPQWFVNKLTITGVSPASLPLIEGILQSAEGQPYSDYNLATDQDNILNYYYSNGYPDAKFAVAVAPAAEPHRMDVIYTITEGRRQYVRDVLVSGYDTTDPDLIASRIRNLEPGSPLSQTAIIENQRRLNDLGIFARVEAAIQNPDGETASKYVLYRFEEASRYTFNFGLGAQFARIGGSTTTDLSSPGGNAGFGPLVSMGISRNNLFGLGHTLSLQGRYSNFDQRAVLSYLAPQFKGNERVNLSLNAIFENARDINTFNSTREEGFIQFQRRMTKASTIAFRTGFRNVNVDPNSVKIRPELIPLASQPVHLAYVSGTYIQDRRDDPIDAHKGWLNTVDTTFGVDVFNQETCGTLPPPACTPGRPIFNRTIARNATYHRIRRDIIFARFTTLGAIAPFTNALIPLPERIYAGGTNSHRGFADNQAGPRDPYTGFPVGGNGLLMNTFELRFPLIGDNIGGVIFEDAGNVYSDFSKISFRVRQNTSVTVIDGTPYITDFDYMVHAIGFGLRYKTPIGPLRLDIAYAINPPTFYGFTGTQQDLITPGAGERTLQHLSHFQFHFSLGQVF
jgi:outer membrane protein insertion porin family